LAATGFGLATGIVSHVMLETAIAGGITGTGEAVVHQTGEGLKFSVAKFFQSIQIEYAKRRAEHFFSWFQNEVWTGLINRLEKGGAVPETADFLNAQKTLEDLRTLST
ncbi:MAG: hypothetical protein ACRC2T_20035, partial [Thermoguttaceae bacterium]